MNNNVGAALCAATICAIAILVAAPVQAQVYRWVDADGRVHFSDKPPPGGAEVLDIQSRPTDLEGALREIIETERRMLLLEEERADEREYQQAVAEYETSLARACQQARDRLANIEPARRLVKRDEHGNIIDEYTVEERLAAVEEARRQVAEWCR